MCSTFSLKQPCSPGVLLKEYDSNWYHKKRNLSQLGRFSLESASSWPASESLGNFWTIKKSYIYPANIIWLFVIYPPPMSSEDKGSLVWSTLDGSENWETSRNADSSVMMGFCCWMHSSLVEAWSIVGNSYVHVAVIMDFLNTLHLEIPFGFEETLSDFYVWREYFVCSALKAVSKKPNMTSPQYDLQILMRKSPGQNWLCCCCKVLVLYIVCLHWSSPFRSSPWFSNESIVLICQYGKRKKQPKQEICLC